MAKINIITVNTETGAETLIKEASISLVGDPFARLNQLCYIAAEVVSVYIFDYGVYSALKGNSWLDIVKYIKPDREYEIYSNAADEVRKQQFYKAAEKELEKLFDGEISEFTVDKISRFNEYVKVTRVEED